MRPPTLSLLLKTPRFPKGLAGCILNLSTRSHKLYLLRGESQHVICEGRTKSAPQYLLLVGECRELFRVLTCKKHEPAFKVTPHTLKGELQPKIKTIKTIFSFHPSAVYMYNIEL